LTYTKPNVSIDRI